MRLLLNKATSLSIHNSYRSPDKLCFPYYPIKAQSQPALVAIQIQTSVLFKHMPLLMIRILHIGNLTFILVYSHFYSCYRWAVTLS